MNGQDPADASVTEVQDPRRQTWVFFLHLMEPIFKAHAFWTGIREHIVSLMLKNIQRDGCNFVGLSCSCTVQNTRHRTLLPVPIKGPTECTGIVPLEKLSCSCKNQCFRILGCTLFGGCLCLYQTGARILVLARPTQDQENQE